MSAALTLVIATSRLSKGRRSKVLPRLIAPAAPVVGRVTPPFCLIPPPFCSATTGLALPAAGRFAPAALVL